MRMSRRSQPDAYVSKKYIGEKEALRNTWQPSGNGEFRRAQAQLIVGNMRGKFSPAYPQSLSQVLPRRSVSVSPTPLTSAGAPTPARMRDTGQTLGAAIGISAGE